MVYIGHLAYREYNRAFYRSDDFLRKFVPALVLGRLLAENRTQQTGHSIRF